jgi:hypothetical protein
MGLPRSVQRRLSATPATPASDLASDGTPWSSGASAQEEGKCLAALRKALMWEVRFAGAAWRNQPIHGLVLVTLADNAPFALGTEIWRWSDCPIWLLMTTES